MAEEIKFSEEQMKMLIQVYFDRCASLSWNAKKGAFQVLHLKLQKEMKTRGADYLKTIIHEETLQVECQIRENLVN